VYKVYPHPPYILEKFKIEKLRVRFRETSFLRGLGDFAARENLNSKISNVPLSKYRIKADFINRYNI